MKRVPSYGACEDTPGGRNEHPFSVAAVCLAATSKVCAATPGFFTIDYIIRCIVM